MIILKSKQLVWIVFFLVGLGYFGAMSHLEMNYFLKSLMITMPLQLGATAYVTYLRWNRH